MSTRTHITVIKFGGHRVVGEFTPEDIRRKIAVEESFGGYVRDIDCSTSCWCVEEGTYDHFKDILA